MLRSREGQYPPAQELAELIYHWMRAFPSAQITEREVRDLYPYIVAKWREGMSLKHIAQTACSCNGKEISPSPVARAYLPRRLVLPPPDAQPGRAFGADSLRDAKSVARLKLTAEVASLKAESLYREIGIIDAKLKFASTESERDRLRPRRKKLQDSLNAQIKIEAEAKSQLSTLEATGKKTPRKSSPKEKPAEKQAEKSGAVTPDAMTAAKKSPPLEEKPAVKTPPAKTEEKTEGTETKVKPKMKRKPRTPKAKSEAEQNATQTPQAAPTPPVPPPSKPAAPSSSERSMDEVEDDISKLFPEEEP